ncbi:hypothetical protein ACEWY4_024286 [Coilia grayii]|uniref:KIAA1522 n=1 Tax=Coilia grayii TaxID=363190 RepID=A0ABD1J3L1_9TELE
MVVFLSKNIRSLFSFFKKRAGPKEEEQSRLTVHYTASQHYQENVFIQASRPKHLQDLHTEAQEGLKILQLEEHKNGVDYQTEQTSATDAPWPETDASPTAQQPSEASVGIVANSSTSSASTGSSFSSRPPLTRQGSTFKPLNPVRRPEKSKRKSRRTTIMGIPQQVQRELVMQRGTSSQEQPAGNGVSSLDVVIIPTIDGETPEPNHEGVRVHLLSIEALQASREEQLLRQHLQALYRDDLALAHRSGPRTSPQQRPKSLAVPGLTSSSFLQEPQGPVMSVSPQATYMSTIIPNAILPAAIDVIQIDRTRTRSNLAVSKSSLTSASPGSSRSGGDTLEPPSSSSCHSQSSETIVSNSSTISSKGVISIPSTMDGTKDGAALNTAHTNGRVPMRSFYPERKESSQRESRVVTLAKVEDDDGEDDEDDEDDENVRDSRGFSRSLSVMKTKQPPAPPRRTFSLHQEKMKRRPKELVEVKDSGGMESHNGQNLTRAREDSMSAISAGSSGHSFNSSIVTEDCQPSSTSSAINPGYPAIVGLPEMSSLIRQNESTAGSNFDRTLSPSSGYSSQSGTPTLSPKEICPPSPERKAKPPKPERTGSKTSLAVSSPALVAPPSSAAPDLTGQEIPSSTIRAPPQATPQPSTVDLRDLLNIPPRPKVKAPLPPPPETWAHNRRTFELLCGPPPNTNKLLHLQQQMQSDNHQTQSQNPPEEHTAAPDPQTPTSGVDENVPQIENQESEVKVQEEQVPVKTHESVTETKCEPQALEMVAMHVRERDTQDGHQRKESCQVDDKQTRNKMSAEDKGPVIPKKEPPPVMKKSIRIKAGQKPEQIQQCIQGLTYRDTVSPPSETLPSLTRDTHSMSKAKVVTGTGNVESLGPESVCREPTHVTSVPEVVCKVSNVLSGPSKLKPSGSSPPPSPPPAHLPPPPPSKTCSASTLPPEEEKEEELLLMDSAWPPPPPPLVDLPDLAYTYEGQDELDFPPPPPPFSQQALSELEQTHPKHSQGEAMVAAQEEKLHELRASAADKGVEVLSTDPELEEEPKSDKTILENPVATLLNPPEMNQHFQQLMSKADSVVGEGQSEEHLTECAGLTGLLDLSTAPSKDPQTLTDEPTLTQEIPPSSALPTPQQVASPTSSTTDSTTKPHEPVQIDLNSETLSPPHVLEDTGPAVPPVAQVTTDTVPGMPFPANLTPAHVPVTTCPIVEGQATVNFRRQPSLLNRENRSSKDLLSRNKSTPTPKEDANIPLVTPSLLQMVRLRAVEANEEQVTVPPSSNTHSEDGTPSQDPSQSSGQAVPQKPIRKSLSLKTGTPATKSPSFPAASPSMRLQEAIRLKTAAMSSRDGLPARLCLRSSMASLHSSETSATSPQSPAGGDLHKSPASTASFIFSKSTKKVVIETPSAPEAQAGLKQSLAAELRQVSDQAKQAIINGTDNLAKRPPSITTKTLQGSNSSDKDTQRSNSSEVTAATEANGGAVIMAKTTGQQAQSTDAPCSVGTQHLIFIIMPSGVLHRSSFENLYWQSSAPDLTLNSLPNCRSNLGYILCIQVNIIIIIITLTCPHLLISNQLTHAHCQTSIGYSQSH